MTHNPDWEALDSIPIEERIPSRRLVPWSDLVRWLDAPPERDWFAEGAIEGNPLVVLSGPEKKAKSWCAIQLTIACVSGSEWLGRFPMRRCGGVVYLDSEYGEHEFVRRSARICRAEGLEPRPIIQAIRHLHSGGVTLTPDNDLLARIISDITESRPALVVLDPFRNHIEGDENSASDVRNALRCVAMLRDAARCPVMVLHHLNKSGTASGSRAIATRADLLIDGTDTAAPLYTTRGRTLRGCDAIAAPFRITVQHEADDNDAVAESFVRLESVSEEESFAEMITALMRGRDGVTASFVADKLGRSREDTRAALQSMCDDGVIEECQVRVRGKSCDGFRAVGGYE